MIKLRHKMIFKIVVAKLLCFIGMTLVCAQNSDHLLRNTDLSVRRTRVGIVAGATYGCKECFDNDGGTFNVSIGQTIKGTYRPNTSIGLIGEYNYSDHLDFGLALRYSNITQIGGFVFNSNFSQNPLYVTRRRSMNVGVISIPVYLNYKININRELRLLTTASLGVDVSESKLLISEGGTRNVIDGSGNYGITDKMDFKFVPKNNLNPFIGFGLFAEHLLGFNSVRIGVDYHLPIQVNYELGIQIDQTDTRSSVISRGVLYSESNRFRGNYLRVSLTYIKGFKKKK